VQVAMDHVGGDRGSSLREKSELKREREVNVIFVHVCVFK
jgi:hypothetical protein